MSAVKGHEELISRALEGESDGEGREFPWSEIIGEEGSEGYLILDEKESGYYQEVKLAEELNAEGAGKKQSWA